MLIDMETLSCSVVCCLFGMFVYIPQACHHVWGPDYHSSEREALNLGCLAISHRSTLLNVASFSLLAFAF